MSIRIRGKPPPWFFALLATLAALALALALVAMTQTSLWQLATVGAILIFAAIAVCTIISAPSAPDSSAIPRRSRRRTWLENLSGLLALMAGPTAAMDSIDPPQIDRQRYFRILGHTRLNSIFARFAMLITGGESKTFTESTMDETRTNWRPACQLR